MTEQELREKISNLVAEFHKTKTTEKTFIPGKTPIRYAGRVALPKNLWVKMTSEIILVLRYFVWVMTINFWGLCPQTPEVYRLNTNPEEVKRWQQ